MTLSPTKEGSYATMPAYTSTNLLSLTDGCEVQRVVPFGLPQLSELSVYDDEGCKSDADSDVDVLKSAVAL